MTKPFKETQKFDQWWLWLPLGVIAIWVVWPIYKAISQGENFDSGQWLGLVVIIGVLGLLFSTKLETSIDENGIQVRFLPFIIKPKLIPWSELDSVHVRQYKPLREYGGWGLRFGPNGKAYNVKGNQGLQLLFKDRTALLIGTQKPKELEEFLRKLGKLE